MMSDKRKQGGESETVDFSEKAVHIEKVHDIRNSQPPPSPSKPRPKPVDKPPKKD